MLRILKLGLSQYAIIAATLLVVLPVIFWFIFGDWVHSLYVDQVVAPRLQQEYGFEVGLVHLGPDEAGDRAWMAVTKVTTGSVLEHAGIRRGDTGCLGVDTGGIGDLYAALEQLEHQTEVEVSLNNTAEGSQACRTVTLRAAGRGTRVEDVPR